MRRLLPIWLYMQVHNSRMGAMWCCACNLKNWPWTTHYAVKFNWQWQAHVGIQDEWFYEGRVGTTRKSMQSIYGSHGTVWQKWSINQVKTLPIFRDMDKKLDSMALMKEIKKIVYTTASENLQVKHNKATAHLNCMVLYQEYFQKRNKGVTLLGTRNPKTVLMMKIFYAQYKRWRYPRNGYCWIINPLLTFSPVKTADQCPWCKTKFVSVL